MLANTNPRNVFAGKRPDNLVSLVPAICCADFFYRVRGAAFNPKRTAVYAGLETSYLGVGARHFLRRGARLLLAAHSDGNAVHIVEYCEPYLAVVFILMGWCRTQVFHVILIIRAAGKT
jgi:hypothetical protein